MISAALKIYRVGRGGDGRCIWIITSAPGPGLVKSQLLDIWLGQGQCQGQ